MDAIVANLPLIYWVAAYLYVCGAVVSVWVAKEVKPDIGWPIYVVVLAWPIFVPIAAFSR